jgi:hypothetical protein
VLAAGLYFNSRPPSKKIRSRRWSILTVCAWHDKLQFYISDFIGQNLYLFYSASGKAVKMPSDKIAIM